MSEIADDMSVSKASLYYYFPDKTALVIKVIKHLIEEGMIAYHKTIENSDNILETLIAFLKIKRDSFEKHYLLHVTMGYADHNLNTAVLNALGQYAAETSELEAISLAFKKGITTKQLVSFDVKKTSQIYFTILKGIGMVSIAKVANKDIPEIPIFHEVFEK